MRRWNRYPDDPHAAAIALEVTEDAKLSDLRRGIGMSATYAAQATCPPTCPLLGRGCYAEGGNVQFTTWRLNRRARGRSPLEIARVEADAIRSLSGRRHLRRGVVGDCRDAASAGIIGAAMAAHEGRHGRRAWGYTHAWQTIRRAAWKGARILASMERLSDIPRAWRRGYAVAVIVASHPNGHRAYSVAVPQYRRKPAQVRIVPCPAEFRRPNGERHTVCEHCAICAQAQPGGYVVGFLPHGHNPAAVREVLA